MLWDLHIKHWKSTFEAFPIAEDSVRNDFGNIFLEIKVREILPISICCQCFKINNDVSDIDKTFDTSLKHLTCTRKKYDMEYINH